jgi:hypothetical protein
MKISLMLCNISYAISECDVFEIVGHCCYLTKKERGGERSIIGGGGQIFI